MIIQTKTCVLLFAIIFALLLSGSRDILAQTSGTTYNLSHSVIAGGGEKSTGAAYQVEGTIGQAVAGTISTGTNPATNAPYSLRGGFWAFVQLAPTAATVSLSGRVFSGRGAGIIRRVRIVLIDDTGIEHTAQTNGFGYYRFDDLEIGKFYIVRAESLNFVFTPASYGFVLMEERGDVNFTGLRLQ
ncbi:MAG TPA: carboxypeptidase-like regulatory domain-containing protein [Pyrinomonadaceae bacterium]|jgi:hypothetical protein